MRKAVLAVAVAVGFAVAAVPASALASSTLSGWWPMYEGSGTTVHDASGHHNNGTLQGGAQWSSGYFGSGLTFDGNTGEVDVPDNASLEPSSAITVAAYVKAAGSPGEFKYVVDKGASDCIAASYGLYTGSNGGLQFYFSQNGGFTFYPSPDAGTGIWDGKWHFVVGTYDGSNVRLYVDGSQVGSGTPASGAIGYGMGTSNDLFIGQYGGPCPGGGDNFAGSVDEPTVWTRAWSANQVTGAYRLLGLLHGFVSRLPSYPNT
ncbi:MAG: LamG domain-containing protein [Solirubrobacteraceae bacterium]